MLTTYLKAFGDFGRNARLFLLTLGLASLILDGVYAVIFNLYLLRLGYDPAFVGQINSAGLLTFALASMPAGMLGRRWGSRSAMIVGLWIVLVGGLLLPVAGLLVSPTQSAWLFACYITMFLGYAIFFVNGVPFLMSATTLAQQDHAFSAMTAIFSLAAFCGGLLGGLLPGLFVRFFSLQPSDPLAYRFPLWMAALLLIPAIWAGLSTKEERPAESGRVKTHARVQPLPMGRSLGRLGAIERSYLGLLGAIAVVRVLQVAGMAVANTFFNVYMDQSLHVPTAQIGVIAATARLLAVPVALGAGMLAARWGNRRLVIFAGLATAMSLLPLALVPYWGAAAAGFIGVAAASAMRYPCFLAYSMKMVREDQRQTMSGLSEMTAGLSFAGMALLGGYLITSLGYTALFLTGALLVLAGTGCFVIYFRRPRGVTPPMPAPAGASD